MSTEVIEKLYTILEEIDILEVAPDLVVEVNSPSDTEERMEKKLKAYQEAGVKLIWSVHMLRKYVLVYYGAEPMPSLVTIDGELEGENVLPGFRLPVKNIFK